jgi:hypothetical protein
MMRYGYLSAEMLARSGSIVAYDMGSCLKAVDRLILGLLSVSGQQTGT